MRINETIEQANKSPEETRLIYGNKNAPEATINYYESPFFRYSVSEPGRSDPIIFEDAKRLASHILQNPKFKYTSDDPEIRKEISSTIQQRLQQAN